MISKGSNDCCVYVKKGDDGSFAYLLLYVDDILIVAKDNEVIRKVKAQLSKKFEMKDFRVEKKLLRIEILRNRKEGKLYLSKEVY